MRILIAAFGSHGDVLPLIGLGRELQRQGQDVCVYASSYFTPYAAAAGVRLRALGDPEDYLVLLRDPDLMHPLRGPRVIARALADYLPIVHAALREGVDRGRTVIIGSPLTFPVRLLQETHAVRSVIVHLSPMTLRSSHELPRLTATTAGPRLPPWAVSLAWRAIDRWYLDPMFAAPLNRYRRTLGLAPIRSVFGRWMGQADLCLALFPDWFAPPQPDWPRPLQQTGFPLFDLGKEAPLAPEVERFLEEGTPPVGFTAGTATGAAHDFFAVSVEACRRLGRRGILLTHRPEHVPTQLPPGIVHYGYVPFSELLPKLAALVHHGGIGTTSQALRAAVPQLIRPMAYDQLDNSRRACALGVAAEVLPRHYRPQKVVGALAGLLGNPRVAERCRHWARALDPQALARSAEVILEAFRGLDVS